MSGYERECRPGGVDLGEVNDDGAAIGGLRSGKIDDHIPGSRGTMHQRLDCCVGH